MIRTHSGLLVDPMNLQPKDIRAEDIAHSLGAQCRFNGHTSTFYSVAQHSILVAAIVDRLRDGWSVGAEALLHDAPETYLTDLPTPIKHLPEMQPYRDAEARAMDVVRRVYGIEKLDLRDTAAVRVGDLLLLHYEAYHLTGQPGWVNMEYVFKAEAAFGRLLEDPATERYTRVAIERFSAQGCMSPAEARDWFYMALEDYGLTIQ